ncbi:hypothetical protein AVEN_166099-1 [Araneus ventricosus]|uniref:Uncharacterized protein n=1 Tax=Araneus ventricosus TaxID=182803 RepID=A0A4Y2FSA8_ARAVE|nr:hypothetical protein AVEN_166099-1 [Araneus ventricosus]
MHRKRLAKEPSLLIGSRFGERVLSNVTLRCMRQYPVEPIVSYFASLAQIRGLEVGSNDIDELVEEHNQDRYTEEVMELHCGLQQ